MHVLEVFHYALLCLVGEPQLPEKEDELNWKLLFAVKRENQRLLREGRGSSSLILLECSNQPIQNGEVRAARESKRPDFTCGFVDGVAGRDMFFVVECKRLGCPTSPSWILNQNYITNGVRRFVDPDWGYGADAASGGMVGYLQTMNGVDTLEDVNNTAQTEQLPLILLQDAVWAERGVTNLMQTLQRSFSESPFCLVHMWVDVRLCYGAANNVLNTIT